MPSCFQFQSLPEEGLLWPCWWSCHAQGQLAAKLNTNFAHSTSWRTGLGGGGTVLGEVAGLGSPAGGRPATRNRYTTTTNTRHMQSTTDLEEEACLELLELHQGQAAQVPGKCVTGSCFLFALGFTWSTARGGTTGAAAAAGGGGSLLLSWQVCVSCMSLFLLAVGSGL